MGSHLLGDVTLKHTEHDKVAKSNAATQPPRRPPSAPTEIVDLDGHFKRYRLISGIIIGLLVILLALATAIILEQRRVTQQVEAQSQEAYGRFMKTSSTAGASGGSNILMRNVRYCWSQEICIDTDRLSATARPLNGGDLKVDDLKSFIVDVHNAKVLISPQTLQGMFNESIFNYPGSNLRNLTVAIREAGKENRITLRGSLKYFLWVPFQMDTNLKVDQATNTLVISVYKLRVFGFIPATWLIELRPFNLQKLLALPENNYLIIKQNQMMVKPFGLFPPPRIDGKMSGIAVTPSMIQLGFKGSESGLSAPDGGNSITLKGGNAQFGKIRMSDADIVVTDANPGDSFKFSLLNYLDYLPQSQVKLQANGGAELRMPDHANIPDVGRDIESPQNDPRLLKRKGVGKDATVRGEDGEVPGKMQRVKAKVKGWLRID